MTAPLLFQLLTFPLLRYDFFRHGGKIETLMRKEYQPVLRRKLPEHYKRRMVGLQARLAERQFANVERHTRARIDRALLYHRGLAGVPQVGLPPLREDGTHIYLEYPIRVLDRQNLLKYLLMHDRDIEQRDFGNSADFACFASYARDCPNARAVARETVLLPTYPGYRQNEVEKNIAAIRSFFRPTGHQAQPDAVRR